MDFFHTPKRKKDWFGGFFGAIMNIHNNKLVHEA